MLKLILLCLSVFLVSASLQAASPAPATAALYFISPLDGAELTSPVVIRFGLKNMGVAPAGVELANTGHHHLLIDTDLPDLDLPVPSDAQHLHFGKGQTETELTLSPGVHTLQLLLGDFKHQAHQDPVLSQKITVSVK